MKIDIPCKIGSTIYRVLYDKRRSEPDACEVVGFWLSEDPTCSRVHLYCCKSKDNWYNIALPLSEFDKTLFTHKIDAITKIAQLKNKKDA